MSAGTQPGWQRLGSALFTKPKQGCCMPLSLHVTCLSSTSRSQSGPAAWLGLPPLLETEMGVPNLLVWCSSAWEPKADQLPCAKGNNPQLPLTAHSSLISHLGEAHRHPARTARTQQRPPILPALPSLPLPHAACAPRCLLHLGCTRGAKQPEPRARHLLSLVGAEPQEHPGALLASPSSAPLHAVQP